MEITGIMIRGVVTILKRMELKAMELVPKSKRVGSIQTLKI
tara:strand:- start:26 stop:148 length:123 start_codon:yes stop_codon:yes gene_type:complete